MCTQRIRARIPAAEAIATGYVTHRRLAFHKLGHDGSGKANAVYTGDAADRVWGVVFRLPGHDKPKLDEFEIGYDDEQVVVIDGSLEIVARTYVAQESVVDDSLIPFDWYHRFVIHGARQHGLPDEYIGQLQEMTSVADSDLDRVQLNARIIEL